jgi:hypothetical protein
VGWRSLERWLGFRSFDLGHSETAKRPIRHNGWEGRYTLVLSGTANRPAYYCMYLHVGRPRPRWLVGLGMCAEYFPKCDLVAGCGQRFLPAPSPPVSTGAPSQARMQGVIKASVHQLPNRAFEASIVLGPAATQRILFSAFRLFVIHGSWPPPEMKRGTPALV